MHASQISLTNLPVLHTYLSMNFLMNREVDTHTHTHICLTFRLLPLPYLQALTLMTFLKFLLISPVPAKPATLNKFLTVPGEPTDGLHQWHPNLWPLSSGKASHILSAPFHSIQVLHNVIHDQGTRTLWTVILSVWCPRSCLTGHQAVAIAQSIPVLQSCWTSCDAQVEW